MLPRIALASSIAVSRPVRRAARRATAGRTGRPRGPPTASRISPESGSRRARCCCSRARRRSQPRAPLMRPPAVRPATAGGAAAVQARCRGETTGVPLAPRHRRSDGALPADGRAAHQVPAVAVRDRAVAGSRDHALRNPPCVSHHSDGRARASRGCRAVVSRRVGRALGRRHARRRRHVVQHPDVAVRRRHDSQRKICASPSATRATRSTPFATKSRWRIQWSSRSHGRLGKRSDFVRTSAFANTSASRATRTWCVFSSCSNSRLLKKLREPLGRRQLRELRPVVRDRNPRRFRAHVQVHRRQRRELAVDCACGQINAWLAGDQRRHCAAAIGAEIRSVAARRPPSGTSKGRPPRGLPRVAGTA